MEVRERKLQRKEGWMETEQFDTELRRELQ